MIDCFNVVDEDKDAAREHEEHGDDAESTDGIETEKDIYAIVVGLGVQRRKKVNHLQARGGSMMFLRKITSERLCG